MLNCSVPKLPCTSFLGVHFFLTIESPDSFLILENASNIGTGEIGTEDLESVLVQFFTSDSLNHVRIPHSRRCIGTGEIGRGVGEYFPTAFHCSVLCSIKIVDRFGVEEN